MSRLALLGCIGLVALVGAPSVTFSAQEQRRVAIPCMPPDQLARVLEQNYGELPITRALSDGGFLMTMFAAGSGATWTLTLTQPTGVSCIFAAGEGLEVLPALDARQVAASPA